MSIAIADSELTGLTASKHPLAPPQPVQFRHQPIYCKPSQISIPHTRKIRRCKARQIMRRPNRQHLSIQSFDNLRCQNCIEPLHIRVLSSKVRKDVPTSSRYFELFILQLSISFNLFNRSRIQSTSRGDVLISCVHLG